MELTDDPAAIRLPGELDAASVAALAPDLAKAFAAEGRVLTLVGAGDEVFCTGLALGARHDSSAGSRAFAEVLGALHAAPKPTLAVVDGRCIGGGLGLAAACDWVLATERSTFALPELLWGFVPAIIWPVVAERMAPHAARQWALTAGARSASEAAAAGLVDEMVPEEGARRAVARAVRMLGRLEPQALRRLRGWTRASRQLPLPDALAQGAALTAELIHEPAVRSRWEAFANGEAPWSS